MILLVGEEWSRLPSVFIHECVTMLITSRSLSWRPDEIYPGYVLS